MSGPSRRLLIAEDHAQTARVCRNAAAAAGFAVIEAATVEEAERAMAAEGADGAVLDADLGGGDASALMAVLRRRRLPVIALIPPRWVEERLERVRLFADELVFKPFSASDLAGALQRLHLPASYGGAPGTDAGVAAGEARPGGEGDLSGTVIAGCRLERILGRGSSGVVYLGRHDVLDVPVAVKLLSALESRWRCEDLARFERGARAAAQVRHPNVVEVLNAGREGEWFYLVQRFLDGEALKARMEREGRMGQAAVLGVLRDMAAGLAAVHRLGVAHRDVKPGNIILTTGGVAVLTDFGLARPWGLGDVSSRSAMIGTPYYMSPEQCDGRALDGRSDLYSLGATAYHALAGIPPIQGNTPVAVLRGHLETPPPPLRRFAPETDAALDAVVMKLLAKRPEDRFATAEDLRRALNGVRIPRPPAS